jgi:hypothetical protein
LYVLCLVLQRAPCNGWWKLGCYNPFYSEARDEQANNASRAYAAALKENGGIPPPTTTPRMQSLNPDEMPSDFVLNDDDGVCTTTSSSAPPTSNALAANRFTAIVDSAAANAKDFGELTELQVLIIDAIAERNGIAHIDLVTEFVSKVCSIY